MAKSQQNLIGAWAFLIGVILALIIGLFGIEISSIWGGLLILLGILIGLFNIQSSEVKDFLLTGVVLVILSSFGGSILQNITINDVAYIKLVLDALVALFVPATIIVALKSVFSLAKN